LKPNKKDLETKISNKNNKKSSKDRFPKGFLWGVAYSSFQVEGGIENNDWWRWAENGKTKEKVGRACDSWNRYDEDHKLAQDLGCGGFRLSLEWSRIEPREGEFSQEALSHYKKILKNVKKRGMKRVVTLWHWGLPLWFADKYGWHKKESVEFFSRYCQKVVDELGGEVDIFLTMNEPTVPLNKGYLVGVFPPGKINLWSYFQARKNMIEAHRECYGIIKKSQSDLPVGITQFCNTFESCGFAKKLIDKFQDFYNWGFIKSDAHCHDFIGIDYYATFEPRFIPPLVKRKTTQDRWTDIGWGIYPRGICDICLQAKKEFSNKPIYIFENGLADDNDKYREDFIQEHLEYLKKAIDQGADVRGYFHWSLLDNFEWNLGYGPKFGLCEVDFETMERKPRKSYYEYGKIVKKNGV
jgi:beta-glucosidase